MLRPYTEADIEQLHRLIREIETADDFPLATSAEEVRENFHGTSIILGDSLDTTDAVVAEADGELIGWGLVEYHPTTGRLARTHLSGGVAPAHRRKGLGRSILDLQVARAAAQMADVPEGIPAYIRADYYVEDVARARLLSSAGFSVARWFTEMLKPLGPTDNEPAADPHGIQVQAWSACEGVDNLGEISLDVRNVAFADHWGTAPVELDVWEEFLEANNTELGLSFVATDGDTGALVGHLLSAVYPEDVEVHGRREGWIENIGTLPEYRKRGIASTMIKRACAAFAESGLEYAALGVDSASPTGANTLYESLGFAPMRQNCMVQLQLSPGRN